MTPRRNPIILSESLSSGVLAAHDSMALAFCRTLSTLIVFRLVVIVLAFLGSREEVTHPLWVEG